MAKVAAAADGAAQRTAAPRARIHFADAPVEHPVENYSGMGSTLWRHDYALECDQCQGPVDPRKGNWNLEGAPNRSRYAQNRIRCAACVTDEGFAEIGKWLVARIATAHDKRRSGLEFKGKALTTMLGQLDRLREASDAAGTMRGFSGPSAREMAQPSTRAVLLEKARLAVKREATGEVSQGEGFAKVEPESSDDEADNCMPEEELDDAGASSSDKVASLLKAVDKGDVQGRTQSSSSSGPSSKWKALKQERNMMKNEDKDSDEEASTKRILKFAVDANVAPLVHRGAKGGLRLRKSPAGGYWYWEVRWYENGRQRSKVFNIGRAQKQGLNKKTATEACRQAALVFRAKRMKEVLSGQQSLYSKKRLETAQKFVKEAKENSAIKVAVIKQEPGVKKGLLAKAKAKTKMQGGRAKRLLNRPRIKKEAPAKVKKELKD